MNVVNEELENDYNKMKRDLEKKTKEGNNELENREKMKIYHE